MHEQTQNLAGKRIVLGLSGGVDSAVAALLLKQQGADVHALHMTNWEDDDGYCTAAADLQDAREICRKLDIPLHHANFARQYRDQVFEYFLQEYRSGRTPNPDVLCNREIKFGVYRDYAHKLGGDYLATGHYARVRTVGGEAQLLKAVDGNKDQSYFLHAVSEEALAETHFPLGDLTKDEVRLMARDAGLDVHDKKDSTGICFIGERPFREFLANWLPAQPGPIVSADGEQLGEHTGLMYYTPGQRQGLGIGGRRESGDEPWYVLAKNLQENELIVVQGEDPRLYSAALDATELGWIGQAPQDYVSQGTLRCNAKIRYRQADQACVIHRQDNDRCTVTFEQSQRAIAPGQFIVFYAGDRCLGGAVIQKAQSEPGNLKAAI